VGEEESAEADCGGRKGPGWIGGRFRGFGRGGDSVAMRTTLKTGGGQIMPSGETKKYVFMNILIRDNMQI